MINDLEESSWAYLLDPCFQFENTKGVPLTGGYIEVYIHGTRDKYYCSKDFDGTLHPFQIPLDSLGANIVLAQPYQAYDIYVYNRYGSLVMSRYNVVPIGAGPGGHGTNVQISSSDGTISIVDEYDPNTGVTTYNLSVDAASGEGDYWYGPGVSALTVADNNVHLLEISEDNGVHAGEDIEVSNGRFILDEGVYFWTVNVDVSSNNIQDKYQQITIAFAGNTAVYQLDMSKASVHTLSFSGMTKNSYSHIPYYVSVKGEGDEFVANLSHVAIHKINPVVISVAYEAGSGIIIDERTISVDPAVIPDIETVTALIDNSVTSLIENITIVSGNVDIVSGNIESISGDIINIQNDITNIVAATGDYLQQEDLDGYATQDWVTGIIPEAQVNSDWLATSGVAEILNKPDEIALKAGSNISIVANGSELTISATGIPDVSNFATQADVYDATVTAIQTATAEIPDVSNFATTEYVDNSVSSLTTIESNVTALIAATGNYLTSDDLNGYATESFVEDTFNNVTAIIPEAQINADWLATSGVAQILNKPDEKLVVAGENIGIFENATAVIIAASGAQGDVTQEMLYDATVTAIQTATAQIPDVSDFTTNSDVYNATSSAIIEAVQTATAQIPDVSDFATNDDVFNANATAIIEAVQTATGEIPEAGQYISIANHTITVTGIEPQVQSDWAVTAVTAIDYIKNKPEVIEYDVVPVSAGTNITIDEVSGVFVISSTASGGGGLVGDYVSGVNNIDWYEDPEDPEYSWHFYQQVTVSGDVKAESWREFDFNPGYKEDYVSASLLGIANSQGTWNEAATRAAKLVDSKTIHEYNSKYEVFDQVYVPSTTTVSGNAGHLVINEDDNNYWLHVSLYNRIDATKKALINIHFSSVTSIPDYLTDDYGNNTYKLIESGADNATYEQIDSVGYNGYSLDYIEAYIANTVVPDSATVSAIVYSGAPQLETVVTDVVGGTGIVVTRDNNEVTIETTEVASGLNLVADKGVVFTVTGDQVIASLDETVLFTGSAASGTAIQLSESFRNFESLRFTLAYTGTGRVTSLTENTAKANDSFILETWHFNSSNSTLYTDYMIWSATSNTQLDCIGSYYCNSLTGGSSGNQTSVSVLEVVGINRIS